MGKTFFLWNFIENSFIAAVDKLIKEGKINGTLQGRLYVPKIFDKARQSYVDTFFRQNKFIGNDH